MSLFIKQLCSVHQQTEEKGITKKTTVKETGYMYNNLLHLIKAGPNSWVLSHELTGYSIVPITMPLPDAKKATILIYNLIDWNISDIEVLVNKINNLPETDPTIKDIVSAGPDTLETIRLKMLADAKALENIISLSFSDA